MTRGDKACRAIRAATRESEVIAAVRDYIDALDSSDAARLPAEILVMGLTPAEELIQSALQSVETLLKAEKGAKGAKGGALRELTRVLTAAARRLADLSAS